jgi:hypothetical protein
MGLNVSDDHSRLWCHFRFCNSHRHGRVDMAVLLRYFLGGELIAALDSRSKLRSDEEYEVRELSCARFG